MVPPTQQASIFVRYSSQSAATHATVTHNEEEGGAVQIGRELTRITQPALVASKLGPLLLSFAAEMDVEAVKTERVQGQFR